MRLLNTKGDLIVKIFHDGPRCPAYAILSHTWYDDGEEVTYADLATGRANEASKGWRKVISARAKARKLGYDYIWIDTCCIDKSSSAELSEAINSMYRWYKDAKVCIVHLSDLIHAATKVASLEQCRWFTRGWTLQEMLAPTPQAVRFYDQDWNYIGNLSDLSLTVFRITEIPRDILQSPHSDQDAHLATWSVAEKMAWVSKRSTTREEDLAYCMLGLFGVNLPIIYGERHQAFHRLQEAILRAHPHDQTILVWNRSDIDAAKHRLLAPEPRYFDRHWIGSIPGLPGTCEVVPPFEVTSIGVKLWAPVIHAPKNFAGRLDKPCLAILTCLPRTVSWGGRAAKVYALELVPNAGTQQYLATQIHEIDAYSIAKRASRAKALSVLFAKTNVEPAGYIPPVLLYQMGEVPFSRAYIRWSGKSSGMIPYAAPEDHWEVSSLSFKLDMSSRNQVYHGRFSINWVSSLTAKKTWVHFCFVLCGTNVLALGSAIKITLGSLPNPIEYQQKMLLAARQNLVELKPTAEQLPPGDKVGDYTLCRAIRKVAVDKILHARLIPAMLADSQALVIELRAVRHASTMILDMISPVLTRLPGVMQDHWSTLRSGTPQELLELGDDADRVLKHNSHYADSTELVIALDAGWYYKDERNKTFLADVRRRRVGRFEDETWYGHILQRPHRPWPSFRDWSHWARHELPWQLWNSLLLLSLLEALFLGMVIFRKTDLLLTIAVTIVMILL